MGERDERTQTENQRRVSEEPLAVLAELKRMGLQRPTYNLASPHGRTRPCPEECDRDG